MRRPLLACILLLCLAAPAWAAAPKKPAAPAEPAVQPMTNLQEPPSAQNQPGREEVHAAGDTWREPVTGMEFVWVPAGPKDAGAGPFSYNHRGACDWDEDCGWLDGFWMGRDEVTQAQWERVMGANPAHFAKGGTYPVESVSYAEALEFIAKLNAAGEAKFALPRVSQWRHAAGSGDPFAAYAGGGQPDGLAWHKGNSDGTTHPVGGKAANRVGIHDMNGNVAEWCDPGSGRVPRNLATMGVTPVPAKEPSAPVVGGGFDEQPRFNSWMEMVPQRMRRDSLGLRLIRLP